LVGGTDAVYLSTPSRIAEILAGAALAVLLDLGRIPSTVRIGAIAASALVVVAMVATPADHGWAYHGGLPLFALLSAVVIAGAIAGGPVRSVLAWRPLVALGAISYSVYLVHWPLFLLVDTHLPTLGAIASLTIKLMATLVVAVAVSAVVEQRFRTARLRPATIPIGLAAVAATATLAVVVAPAKPAELARASTGLDPQSRPIPRDTVAAATTLPGAPNPTATAIPVPSVPPRIMVVGDSTGDVVGAGLVEWANANPTLAAVEVRSVAGCGLVTGGRFGNAIDDQRETCDRATQEEIPTSLFEAAPDVVVISIAVADTWSRSWDGGPVLRATDPEYAARIGEAYDRFFDTAAAAGVPHVVWLRPPIVGLEPRYYDPSFVDGSQEVVEAVVRRAAERRPAMITVLDYRSWFEGTSLPEDAQARPDGVHLSPAAALRVATEYLGPQITLIAR
jgi:lysophospholipase L1-like esterase